MNRLEIFIDGASAGQGNNDTCETCGVTTNAGDAALGVVIYAKGKKVGQFARGLGRRTNNEAEYEALICALQICWLVDELRDPRISSDSLVVVNQVNGTWQCKSPNLIPLLLTIRELQEVVRMELVHVSRDVVWEADALAHMFLEEQRRHSGLG